MSTIVLTGGGSAGHCTPNIALLPYLKEDFDKIYYIGSENGIERQIVKKNGIEYFFVPCAKLVRKLTVKNLTIPFALFKGVKKAGKILDKIKPDIVFSKGGYVSVPVVIAAKKRKIPVIAHESDYTLGLANKISSKYCKYVLTSFAETSKQIGNGRYIGSPIRKDISLSDKKVALSFFNFTGKKPIILFLGGSLGSRAINNALYGALDRLLVDFDVIHICGKGNFNKNCVKKGYYQTEFLDRIEYAFSVCSVCVSRAGSNALFELLYLSIPTLLIPLPKDCSRGDQILNANYFLKKGMVSVLPQECLTAESLINDVNALYLNRKNVKENLSKHPVLNKSREISLLLADCRLK